ncbi:MAG TPA: hypothetical protein VFW44_15725 [Bryobacteraceae bacterium]|nr:hypothetical protein [Bryobacteraceae bacterium]
MSKFAILLLTASGAFAEHAIAPPQLGFIADQARVLRPVYGMAGSFILGPAMRAGVLNQAFSGSLGLLKTDSLLAAFNAQGASLGAIDASRGAAIFAFSPDGTTALAYVASSNALYEWKDGAFSRNWFHPVEGAVRAIAFPTPSAATLIVERTVDDLWAVRVPLAGLGMLSESALTGVHTPVLALPSGDLVYATGGAMAIRHASGVESRIPASLPASFSLQQMNRDWVELRDDQASTRFGLRVTPSREGIYRLPE